MSAKVQKANRPWPTSYSRPDVGYVPDGRWGDLWVEISARSHSFRNVRASLLGMAYLLAADPASRGLLVLVGTRITEERLEQERKLFTSVLDPAVGRRLGVAMERGGRFLGLPANLDAEFDAWLRNLIAEGSAEGKPRRSFSVILGVLLHQWLLDRGPVTTEWLGKTAGVSYPTVAGALRRLEDRRLLERHSDRRVELRNFPREEWARLVAMSDEFRGPACFADRSGQPRSPEALAHRLVRLVRPDLAIGGALGARHYHPELDLVGAPRLDVTLHCPGAKVDWTFVERLDPALERVGSNDERVGLVVHVLRRSASLFQSDDEGRLWADPVECLLDLHEARLEPQAEELLQAFEARRADGAGKQ